MRKSKFKIRYAVFFAAIVLFFALFFWRGDFGESKLFQKISVVNFTLVSPAFYAKNKIYDFYFNMSAYFKFKKELSAANESLKQENQKLKSELLEASSLKNQNKELLELLGRMPEGKFITASVLFRPPYSDFDTFVIDAGKKEGIARGMKVLTYGGIMLGEISEVFDSKSIVSLYSYGGNKINVVLENPPVLGIAEGKGGENFELVLPKEADAREGERVLTEDTKPFILGEITKIEQKEGDLFKKAYFRYPINLNELRYVFVAM